MMLLICLHLFSVVLTSPESLQHTKMVSYVQGWCRQTGHKHTCLQRGSMMQDWNSKDPCLPSKNHSLSHKLDGVQPPLENRSWVTSLKILIERPVSPLLPPKNWKPNSKVCSFAWTEQWIGSPNMHALEGFSIKLNTGKNPLSQKGQEMGCCNNWEHTRSESHS